MDVGQSKQMTPSTKKQANLAKSTSLYEQAAIRGPPVSRLMCVVKGQRRIRIGDRERQRYLEGTYSAVKGDLP